MPAPVSGQPLWLRFRHSGARADQVLDYFGIERAPINVFEIARRMGITITRVANSPHCGVLTASESGAAGIVLREEDSPTRQRFTVAHEIGHLLRHELGEAFRDDSYTGSPLEHEANTFAAELLMPDELLDAAVRKHGTVPKVLSRLFLVSDLSMRVRLMRWTEL